ncbi:MAG: hypothetical protein ACREMI_07165 [Gemmatimonadales bacterium]
MKRFTAVLTSLIGVAALAACNERTPGADNILASATASSPMSVSRSFEQLIGATATSTVTGCSNSPGPNITIEGNLRLGGLGTRMTFTNNAKGTHTFTDEAHVDITLVPSDGNTITIPKQPVLGGVGGNPFIWIQLEDGNGRTVTDEVFLGRCVQGLKKDVSASFASAARALATIAVADCQNSPGPFITLDGDLYVAAGLDAVFIFQNNDNPVGGPHRATADRVVKVQLVPPGHDVRFAKQPSQGGVGGNPWIWFNFLNDAGSALTDPSLLGRCEQLSKA